MIPEGSNCRSQMEGAGDFSLVQSINLALSRSVDCAFQSASFVLEKREHHGFQTKAKKGVPAGYVRA